MLGIEARAASQGRDGWPWPSEHHTVMRALTSGGTQVMARTPLIKKISGPLKSRYPLKPN